VLSRARTTSAIAILGVAATVTVATAEPRDASTSQVTVPAIVLDSGVVIARASLESSLSRGALFAPVSIAPDVWVGVTDRLTLGATSSEAARGWVGAGRGACLRGAAHGCDSPYGGAAGDARFRLYDGAIAVAGRAALDFRRFGPGVVALEIGAVVRARAGALTVTVEPYVSLGIVNASLDNHVAGVLPLEARWALAPRVRAIARTGVRGDVDDFFATAQLPFALALDVDVGAGVTVGAGAGLPRALGAMSGTDARVADVHVEWRN
jgi:hypothetical protein